MASSSSSSSYLFLLTIILTFSIISARPCKTFLISSYSLSITPQEEQTNPNSHSDLPTRFVTVFTIRRLSPNHIVPFFVNRHNLPQQPQIPIIESRSRDILSVVVALLFGVGCGALTAATMYLVWALVVNRQSYNDYEEEEDYENEESDAACLKKLGYVKIPEPAAPVKE